MKLSEKLIKIRKQRGLSQEEFGNELNVSRQSVSKWENEEARPDIDKVKEIVKKFNVSYEYLLNDEIEEETIEISNKKQGNKSKIALKIILSILLLYLLICSYKFIAFYRFYLIANSFSEENYMMSQSFKTSNQLTNVTFIKTKIGNKILQKSYSFENSNAIRDEDGNIIPYGIEFTDMDEKISYQLNYDKEKSRYIYHNRKEDMINDEEIEGLFRDENGIKENTLNAIPSGFKEIFLASIDPRYYYVSINKRQFESFSFSDGVKTKVKLNNDYLVESVQTKSEYNGLISIIYSYDYVQDHFDEIQNPLEKYGDKILYDKE